MSYILDQLAMGLLPDERIVYPSVYKANPKLYEEVVSIAYLILFKEDNTDGFEWVWASTVDGIEEMDWMESLIKVFIVKIRLPWGYVPSEFLYNQEEYDKNADEVDIIETFITAVDSKGNIHRNISKLELESNRDEYQIQDIHYLVTWKSFSDDEPRSLNIPEDNIHTVLSE